MTHLRGIALIAVTFLISIATLSAAEQESLLITTTHCAQTTEQPEAEICISTTSLLTSTQTSGSTHSITPLSRTLPRSLRHSEHQHNTSRVVSAIDSTMAASRYGLYNHKILFVSHARHYYLCRLVRLII